MSDWRRTSAYQPHAHHFNPDSVCNGPVYWQHAVNARICETCGASNPARIHKPRPRKVPAT